nr:MAG TPA: hypothetical protein [Caudoviricetes sp.]
MIYYYLIYPLLHSSSIDSRILISLIFRYMIQHFNIQE